MGEAERSLWRDRSFAKLWVVGALTSTARWLELLVVGIYVFEVTASPLWVASMLTLRMTPMAIFGIFGGALAARFDRRRVLVAALLALTALSFVVAAIAYVRDVPPGVLAVVAFLAGFHWAIDFPVRRTLLGEIAGIDRAGKAMSLDTMASSGTRVLGPLMGGGVYATIGLEGAFVATGLLYLVAAWAMASVSARGSEPSRGSVVDSIRAGWVALRRQSVLVATMAATILYNIWAFPVISMIPVIGKDSLGLAPFEVGVLASIEGVGSIVGAILLSLFTPLAMARRIFVGGIAGYLALTIVFANVDSSLIAGFALLGLGFTAAGFAAMQSALVLVNTDASTRQQMMGVLSVCIGSAPIGFAHMGVMADWLGAPMACTVVAIEGIVAFVIIVWRFPELLGKQPPVEMEPSMGADGAAAR